MYGHHMFGHSRHVPFILAHCVHGMRAQQFTITAKNALGEMPHVWPPIRSAGDTDRSPVRNTDRLIV